MKKFHRFHVLQFKSKQILLSIQHRRKNKSMLLYQQIIKHEQVKRNNFINRHEYVKVKSHKK